MTAHVKHIILAAILAISGLLVTWKVLAHYDRVDKDEADIAKAQVAADIEKAQLQASQTKTDTTDLQNKINSLVASNASLKASLANLRSKLDSQRKQDDNLSLADLSTRWSMLTGVPGSEFQPNTTGVQVSSLGAHSTVNQLEELPVLKQELKDSQDNSSKKDDTLTSQQKVISDTQAELATCKKTLTDQEDSCQKKIDQINSDNRKHSFFYSVVSFLFGVLVKH